jgi:hypothetical protein
MTSTRGIKSRRLMRTLVIKGKDRLWPTVTWKDTNLIVYYLGADDDDVSIRETKEIDFDELFLHLDRGGSIFMTVRPSHPDHLLETSGDESDFMRTMKGMLPELVDNMTDSGR